MRAWVEKTQGFLLPESEIVAVNRTAETGRILGRKPGDTSPRFDWFGKLPPPRWEAIDCPALGLYAVTAPLEMWLPHYTARHDSLSQDERQRVGWYVEAFSAWTAERREEFGRFPHNEVVEFPATGHYFFLEQPEQERALDAIRQFVARLQKEV
jgi:pimeloyl-ACP methyl ester carboxylesterase